VPVVRDAMRLGVLTTGRGLRAMVGIGTAILVIGALGIAQAVFAPLAFALFVVAIVWPLQRVLQVKLPKLLALAVCMTATIIVIASFAWVITWAFSRVGRYVVLDAERFQLLYNQIAGWLEGHGIVVASLWQEHFNIGWVFRLFQEIAAIVNGMLSFIVIVMIYVMLGLLEVNAAAARLRDMADSVFGRVVLAGCTATSAKFRRYLVVRSLMSVITGVLVWAFLWLLGLPLASEWGVIAFVLNYIPFIGPLIATILPTCFAVAQFDAWQNAVVMFACLNVIQFLVGSYLEPRVAGNTLSMSPFLVLLAVFFWTWLWGIAGALIGVPIVIAVLTLCEQHEASRWVAELCGAPSRGAGQGGRLSNN
jgi:AI-2 transport protein TqsA